MTRPVLLLSRRDIRALMTPTDYFEVVAEAFRASKQEATYAPPPMHIPVSGGGFHAKGASFTSDRPYVALKLNGNFPANPERTGLPTIQGAILLCDAENGSVLALMDSIEITLMRTAAASAIAARHLARKNASTLCICGCGDQGRAQATALAEIMQFASGYAWDIDARKVRRFADEMSEALGFKIEVAPDLQKAARASDVIVTCTTSRSPFLDEMDVSPGAFVAAVGADSPDKSELAPGLMARSTIVVDVLDQCLAMGDLRNAVQAGAVSAGNVHAELGDLVIGAKRGRTRDDEIIVFDSTGTAIQDAASAALIYERALGACVGASFHSTAL